MADEEFPVLTLQGNKWGRGEGWREPPTSAAKAGPHPARSPAPTLPAPTHLHRRPQQQPKDAFQLLHCLLCRAQVTGG